MPAPSAWNAEAAEVFHRQVREEYPTGSSATVPALTLDLPGGPKEQHDIEAFRFSNAGGGLVLTVGPGLLGISVRPDKLERGYPGWAVLHRIALDLLAKYQALMGVTRALQIRVRYINAIPITPGTFLLGDYLSPTTRLIPEVFRSEANPFSLRTSRLAYASEEWGRNESVRLAAGFDEERNPRLFFQIDQIALGSSGLSLQFASKYCEELHAAAHNVFADVLSQTLLESFEPDAPLSAVNL